MDHAHAVGVGETIGRLRDNGEALARRNRRIALLDDVVECMAANKLHDHVEIVAFGNERIDRRDVGMIEPREACCLGTESLDKVRIAQQFRTERLQRHFALKNGVVRSMDPPDAAFAELFTDFVLADGFLHFGQEIRVAA